LGVQERDESDFPAHILCADDVSVLVGERQLGQLDPRRGAASEKVTLRLAVALEGEEADGHRRGDNGQDGKGENAGLGAHRATCGP
jgi:hypothetical protein